MNEWKNFDLKTYIKNNYSYIHEEDEQIIKRLVKFYVHCRPLKLGLDIGTGPNLYPIIMMLPVINKIESVDYNLASIDYLKKQVVKPSDNWRRFFSFIKKIYKQYGTNLSNSLRTKVVIKQGNIYQLTEKKYDLVSMFFCAESITDKYREFINACGQFIRAAKINGFLIASFMENSTEYFVGRQNYKTYSLNSNCLKKIFSPWTKKLRIYKIKKAKIPLRQGYTGILLLTAVRKQ